MIYIYKNLHYIIPTDTIPKSIIIIFKKANNFQKNPDRIWLIYHNRPGTISFCWIASQIALLHALMESGCGFKWMAKGYSANWFWYYTKSSLIKPKHEYDGPTVKK